MRTRKNRQLRREELGQTDCGRILLALIEEFGSQAKVAEICKTEASTVGSWFRLGRVSRNGALALAEATGRMKEEFRPDLSSADWRKRVCGRVNGKPSAEPTTTDGMILVSLAEKFGSLSSAATTLGFTPNNFNDWKSRGKIPVAHVRSLMAAL